MEKLNSFLESLVSEETFCSIQKMDVSDQQVMELFGLATLAVFHPERVQLEQKINTQLDGTQEMCYIIRTSLQ